MIREIQKHMAEARVPKLVSVFKGQYNDGSKCSERVQKKDGVAQE